MGYHINLERRGSASGISEEEWCDFVGSRPELDLTDESNGFITAVLDGNKEQTLHYSKGSASVFTKNPDGPRIIEYMASIAPFFDAIVTGDEGEEYATEADWGTESEWNTPPEVKQKPLSKRELSPRKRIVAGILFGALLIIVKEVFFPSR